MLISNTIRCPSGRRRDNIRFHTWYKMPPRSPKRHAFQVWIISCYTTCLLGAVAWDMLLRFTVQLETRCTRNSLPCVFLLLRIVELKIQQVAESWCSLCSLFEICALVTLAFVLISSPKSCSLSLRCISLQIVQYCHEDCVWADLSAKDTKLRSSTCLHRVAIEDRKKYLHK